MHRTTRFPQQAGVAGAISGTFAQSAVAASHTGNTTETALATIPLPGGSLGSNGQIEIVSLWSHTNNANVKTMRAKLGTAAPMAVNVTTTVSTQTYTRISNRNAQNSQVGAAAANAGSYNASSGAAFTSAIDTAADQNITLTAQLANAADTITLESYIIKVFPGA